MLSFRIRWLWGYCFNIYKQIFFNTSRGSTIARTNSSFDNEHFQNVSFIKTQKTGIFDILATVT